MRSPLNNILRARPSDEKEHRYFNCGSHVSKGEWGSGEKVEEGIGVLLGKNKSTGPQVELPSVH